MCYVEVRTYQAVVLLRSKCLYVRELDEYFLGHRMCACVVCVDVQRPEIFMVRLHCFKHELV